MIKRFSVCIFMLFTFAVSAANHGAGEMMGMVPMAVMAPPIAQVVPEAPIPMPLDNFIVQQQKLHATPVSKMR